MQSFIRMNIEQVHFMRLRKFAMLKFTFAITQINMNLIQIFDADKAKVFMFFRLRKRDQRCVSAFSLLLFIHFFQQNNHGEATNNDMIVYIFGISNSVQRSQL